MDPASKPSRKVANNNCKTCRHPKRDEIDRQLIARVTLREVAARYHLTRAALYRHYRRHMGKKLEAVRSAEQRHLDTECSEIAKRDLLSAGRILDELGLALDCTRRALTDAVAAKDSRAFAGAVSLVQKNVALLATLSGTVRLASPPRTIDGEDHRNQYVLAVKRALGLVADGDEEPSGTWERDAAKQDGDGGVPAGVDDTEIIEAEIVRQPVTTPPVPKRPSLPAPATEANIKAASNTSHFDWKRPL
jgi:hypothetical protein